MQQSKAQASADTLKKVEWLNTTGQTLYNNGQQCFWQAIVNAVATMYPAVDPEAVNLAIYSEVIGAIWSAADQLQTSAIGQVRQPVSAAVSSALSASMSDADTNCMFELLDKFLYLRAGQQAPKCLRYTTREIFMPIQSEDQAVEDCEPSRLMQGSDLEHFAPLAVNCSPVQGDVHLQDLINTTKFAGTHHDRLWSKATESGRVSVTMLHSLPQFVVLKIDRACYYEHKVYRSPNRVLLPADGVVELHAIGEGGVAAARYVVKSIIMLSPDKQQGSTVAPSLNLNRVGKHYTHGRLRGFCELAAGMMRVVVTNDNNQFISYNNEFVRGCVASTEIEAVVLVKEGESRKIREFEFPISPAPEPPTVGPFCWVDVDALERSGHLALHECAFFRAPSIEGLWLFFGKRSRTRHPVWTLTYMAKVPKDTVFKTSEIIDLQQIDDLPCPQVNAPPPRYVPAPIPSKLGPFCWAALHKCLAMVASSSSSSNT
jgi:hypothetical protein